MHNVSVTGGAGFTGHHLIERLSRIKSKLVVLDNLTNPNANFLHRIKIALQASTTIASNSVILNEVNKVSIYLEERKK